MQLPESQGPKFFIFVVESPSAEDLYLSRSEGGIIKQAANLNEIPYWVTTTINLETFKKSFNDGLINALNQYPRFLPIIHISAHGNQDGIQLSSGDFISWEQLRTFLSPINVALQNKLLVSLSCCESHSGSRMAMFLEDDAYPFYALISNYEKPLWSDTAVAYSVFYHLISKGASLEDAVKAMQIASGNNKFNIEFSNQSRKGYLEYLKNIDADKVRTTLEE